MVNRPDFISSIQIPHIEKHRYERYLATAFSDDLTMIQKINKIIEFLYQYSYITEEMLTKWNEVYSWVTGEGLDNAIVSRLNEMLEDGTLEKIINEAIFSDLNSRIGDLERKIVQLIHEFTILKDDYYNLGITKIYRGE